SGAWVGRRRDRPRGDAAAATRRAEAGSGRADDTARNERASDPFWSPRRVLPLAPPFRVHDDDDFMPSAPARAVARGERPAPDGRPPGWLQCGGARGGAEGERPAHDGPPPGWLQG